MPTHRSMKQCYDTMRPVTAFSAVSFGAEDARPALCAGASSYPLETPSSDVGLLFRGFFSTRLPIESGSYSSLFVVAASVRRKQSMDEQKPCTPGRINSPAPTKMNQRRIFLAQLSLPFGAAKGDQPRFENYIKRACPLSVERACRSLVGNS